MFFLPKFPKFKQATPDTESHMNLHPNFKYIYIKFHKEVIFSLSDLILFQKNQKLGTSLILHIWENHHSISLEENGFILQTFQKNTGKRLKFLFMNSRTNYLMWSAPMVKMLVWKKTSLCLLSGEQTNLHQWDKMFRHSEILLPANNSHMTWLSGLAMACNAWSSTGRYSIGIGT